MNLSCITLAENDSKIENIYVLKCITVILQPFKIMFGI